MQCSLEVEFKNKVCNDLSALDEKLEADLSLSSAGVKPQIFNFP